ncbi:Coproporphyrinogen III oxidase [Suillus paluster]|uniref:Coproporphyrinogen III oxidase n=1 Tax=Suillus paluster TaxID=48578 RepID=UPI001B86A452|nr:Coproporphyrinogen III oxidase [Suillus paluster]KAG1739406.1 Coproporphyrinogen III oxidase [Suillus paluster]
MREAATPHQIVTWLYRNYPLATPYQGSFEKLDPNAPSFKRDSWLRAQGGKGVSGVFFSPPPTDASPGPQTILEKAGVNISVVHGMLPPAAIKEMRADHSNIPYDEKTSLPFFAAGISLVVHPRNPHAPTVHANYRYFEITEKVAESDGTGKVVAWWFGGGSDLTPSYLYEEDARHFHRTLQNACNQHGSELYPAFKKWCDEYFYIVHRQETRGVGGLFFDDLSTEKHARLSDDVERPRSAEEIFDFIKALGNSFIPSYLPILERRMSMPSTDQHRRWQLLRRGRYVEFNLVYDRGTKFGLKTPSARIESILMSLPETARWEYMTDMGTDLESEEGRLIPVLKQPVDWAALEK